MTSKDVEFDILKCGLCCKLLNIPKTLPCLHMFCETCIYQFASSELKQFATAGSRNIQCPICKTKLAIPGNIDVSVFVRKLPTNENIEAILKGEKSSLNETLCGPCQRKENIKKTKTWCVECKEGICDECCKVHSTIRSCVFHKTVEVSDIDAESSPINVDIFCTTHKDKKLDHFCEDHKQPCCHICETTEHSMCSRRTTLEDAARKNKTKTETTILLQKLNNTLDSLKDNIDERDNFLQDIEFDRDGVKRKIASFRVEINNRLDELELKFDKEFENLHYNKSAGLNTKTNEIKNTCKIISNCKRLLEILLKRSSEIGIFLEKEKIKRKFIEQKEILKNLSVQLPYKYQYKVSFAPELIKLKNSLQSLGVVECVTVTPVQLGVGEFSNVPYDASNANQRDVRLHELMTIISEKCCTNDPHGVELLPNGRVLLARYDNKSLCCFDNYGNLEKEIELPGKPRDVTMISNSECAVTYYYNFGIFLNQYGVCIVDVVKMFITQQNIISDTNYCVNGITCSGDEIIIACYGKIIILDMKGSLIKEIKTSPSSSYKYITSVSDKVFCYSNREEQSVTCMNMNGIIIFKYKHDQLDGVRGITSDKDGTIYVSGQLSNNVHQISPEGNLIKILLGKNDGITSQYAINLDRRNKRLLLTHSGSSMTVYQLNS